MKTEIKKENDKDILYVDSKKILEASEIKNKGLPRGQSNFVIIRENGKEFLLEYNPETREFREVLEANKIYEEGLVEGKSDIIVIKNDGYKILLKYYKNKKDRISDLKEIVRSKLIECSDFIECRSKFIVVANIYLKENSLKPCQVERILKYDSEKEEFTDIFKIEMDREYGQRDFFTCIEDLPSPFGCANFFAIDEDNNVCGIYMYNEEINKMIKLIEMDYSFFKSEKINKLFIGGESPYLLSSFNKKELIKVFTYNWKEKKLKYIYSFKDLGSHLSLGSVFHLVYPINTLQLVLVNGYCVFYSFYEMKKDIPFDTKKNAAFKFLYDDSIEKLKSVNPDNFKKSNRLSDIFSLKFIISCDN